MTKQQLINETSANMEAIRKTETWRRLLKENDNILTADEAQNGVITQELIQKFYAMAAGKNASYRTADEVPGFNRIPKAADLDHYMTHYISQMQISRQMFHPVEYAAICYKRFLEICPFTDHNEEVADKLLGFLLLNAGYVPVDLKAEDMEGYKKALAASQHPSSPDIDGFTLFLLQALDREEKRLLHAENS